MLSLHVLIIVLLFIITGKATILHQYGGTGKLEGNLFKNLSLVIKRD
jgi:hypothetical protein